MQSSALPLGHAALKAIDNLSADRISKGNQNVLFLSNGHGEDLIALRVIEKLHDLVPTLSIQVLPLVGEGKIFANVIAKDWIDKIELSKSLPSGGFSNQSFRALLADICSGLFFVTWKQWHYVRWAARNKRLIIAIGDLFPLFLAWSSGAPYSFIGTPKSDYTWTSGPGSAISDFYHRLKGSEWDPWECALMKSSRCKMIGVRDHLTARGLGRNGVLAHSPGNPMMDGFEETNCPDDLKDLRRLLLLCGSRMPEAFENFKNLMNAVNLLQTSQDMVILVATGSDPSLNLLESFLQGLGYRAISCLEIGAKSCWKKGNISIFLGSGCFSKWASWVEIGLANAGTATEQVVGLGIPCISLPGNGPQFNRAFANRQSRLLGGSVLPCNTPEIFAHRLELLLRDSDLRNHLGAIGRKRMGVKGGSQALSHLISQHMLKI